LNMWMRIFYRGTWNACKTTRTISDICRDVHGLCLWSVGL
jgi:hypothetical protein